MKKLWQHAIAAVARLPEDEQETVACLMLEEIEAGRGWDERFAKSENKLSELAQLAKGQHARGETTPLIFPEK